jgi:hypothetical protein
MEQMLFIWTIKYLDIIKDLVQELKKKLKDVT